MNQGLRVMVTSDLAFNVETMVSGLGFRIDEILHAACLYEPKAWESWYLKVHGM